MGSIAGTLSAENTSESAAQANVLASSKANVERLNKDLIFRYNRAYADYVTNMRSGNHIPDEQRQPPKPPMAWELAPPDAEGYVWYQQSATTPVCPAGPLVTPNSDYAMPLPIAHHIGMNWNSRPDGPAKGSFVTATKDDGMPGGFVTPPTSDPNFPGEPPHTYMRLTTAVGPGWYQELD